MERPANRRANSNPTIALPGNYRVFHYGKAFATNEAVRAHLYISFQHIGRK